LVGIPYDEDFDIKKLNMPKNEGAQICLMHIHAGLNSGMIFFICCILVLLIPMSGLSRMIWKMFLFEGSSSMGK
jgi:hypothetical protein